MTYYFDLLHSLGSFSGQCFECIIIIQETATEATRAMLVYVLGFF